MSKDNQSVSMDSVKAASTEDNSGWRKILSLGLFYKAVQFVFSEKNSKTFILENYINAIGPDCRILDIGCGPGNLLEFMPTSVNYVGFDVNENYISAAIRNNADRQNALFLLGNTKEMFESPELPDASVDVAIIHGVFHHVTDDIASEMIQLAQKKLKAGGKLLTLEPVWFEGQSRFRKWVMSKDRGKNIKTEASWKQLYRNHSEDWVDINFDVRGDLIRFYDLLVTELIRSK